MPNVWVPNVNSLQSNQIKLGSSLILNSDRDANGLIHPAHTTCSITFG